MKRTKEIFTQGYYVFESRVAANSNYIEDIREARALMCYANYYLKDYLHIYDYVITRHGWQFIVRIRGFKTLQKNSKHEIRRGEVWRIISERIRLFISSYVRYINRKRGRTGVLVHSSYERFYFESVEEAVVYLEKLRNQQIKLYQRKKRYRGLKKHYSIGKEEGKGSIFLCSKELKRDFRRWNVQFIQYVQPFVLRELVKKSLSNHNLPFQNQNLPNSS